jgi:hypothetical protein
MQVLRQHSLDARAVAPDVVGLRYRLPPGFYTTVVDHNVGGVRYDTPDPDAVLRDLTRYRDDILVDPPAHAKTDGQGLVQYGDFHTYPNRHGGLTLTSDNFSAPFGVTPVERFAHVVGRTPGHSPNFTVGFQCAMLGVIGQGADARSERIALPVDDVLGVLANVTGLPQIGQAQRIPESSRYNLPDGGYVQITGSVHDYRDHTIAARRDTHQPAFTPPFFQVQIQVGGGVSNEELDLAAKRLSAWLWLQTDSKF